MGKTPDLGRVVIDLRRRLRATQGEIGDTLGLSARTVMRWESGKSAPSAAQSRVLLDLVVVRAPDIAARMAAALGLAHEKAAAGPAPDIDRARLHAEVRGAADELDVTARALRRALRGLVGELQRGGVTLDKLYDALADEPPRRGR